MSNERIWIHQEEGRLRKHKRNLIVAVIVCCVLILSVKEIRDLAERLQSLRAARNLGLFLSKFRLKAMKTQLAMDITFFPNGRIEVRESLECSIEGSQADSQATPQGMSEHQASVIAGPEIHILTAEQAKPYLLEGEATKDRICFHPRRSFSGEIVIILAHGYNLSSHRGILPMARVSVSGNSADINID